MTLPLALVVDDDPDIRLITELALARVAGWEVITADRARAGIELARTHHPSVVLMDLMMPEMDGIEATRLLHADPLTADIPVVLVTAKSAVRGDEPPWAGVDFAGVIPKPFNPRTLAQEVSEMVGWSVA
ncbi:MAG: response regulator [Dietzia sp.]